MWRVGDRQASAGMPSCAAGRAGCALGASPRSPNYRLRGRWPPPPPSSTANPRSARPPTGEPGGGEYEDIRYELADGIAKLTIDRPEVRNAFRPETLVELSDALERAREDTDVGVIVLTGEGPLAFCSGGDQRVRGDSGYVAGGATVGRFHVTDLQVQMRRTPKPIVAMIAGYAIGGGHVLHVVCDLSIAADNARFGQTGPEGRQLRRRLRRQPARRSGRPEEGQGDLVPVPPVLGATRRWRWAS